MAALTKRESQKTAIRLIYWSITIGVICLLIGCCVGAARKAYQIGYAIFYDAPYDAGNETEIVVTVPEGCTMQMMAKALEEEAIIADDLVFYLQAKLYQYELMPGKHVIQASMTGTEILKVLSETEAASEGASEG